jgi:chromatin remodeling complex protein RSC6
MMSNTAAATKGKKVAKKAEDVTATAPVAAAAPVAETKKPGRKAAAATAAPAATPAASAPVTHVEPAAAPAAPSTTLDDDLKNVLSTLTTLRETVSTMITEVKRLDKRVHREIKDARKRKRKAKLDENGNEVKRGPSIFEIPQKVSDELCKFLGKPTGTQISRSNVTKEVNAYIKTHNLKNKHDIKPDAALRKLLGVTESDALTYFNLQRFLNKHYIKATA